jgi:hypothetical protein
MIFIFGNFSIVFSGKGGLPCTGRLRCTQQTQQGHSIYVVGAIGLESISFSANVATPPKN